MQQIVHDLSERIGLGNAIEIVRRWGGRELRVPRHVEAGDPLALTLGLDVAKKLCWHFGGERLQLPAERNALLDLRNQAVMERIAEGKSMESVGLEFGITRQRVKQIKRKFRADA
ncbi:MAG: Mor transcription activator family protein [Beijerinckiaceae bacterium]